MSHLNFPAKSVILAKLRNENTGNMNTRQIFLPLTARHVL